MAVQSTDSLGRTVTNREDDIDDPECKITLTESENDTEHVLIDSTNPANSRLVNDLEIEGSVKSSVDQFNFTLDNKDDQFDYISGNDKIKIELGYGGNMTTVMRGIVTRNPVELSTNGNVLQIEGMDFGQILHQRKPAEVYLNESMYDIIIDLMDKYVPEISTDNVQDPNVTLDSKRIAYESIFDVIKDFAERQDYQFYVDNQKDLHFEPEGYEDGNHTFEEAKDILMFRSTPNLDKVVNEAIIFGSKRQVKEEETFTGDGSTKVFQTTFKPHDPNVTVDGTHKQGGAEGVTNLSQVDYVYDIDTREFEFGNAPSNGDTITINYTRNIPIQAITEDSSSKSEYGQRREPQTIPNITRYTEAKNIADKLVNNFGQPPEEAEAEVIAVQGLRAGQTVDFDIPSLNISTQKYDVVRVNYIWGTSGYKMNLKLNEEPRKIEDVIKHLSERIKSTQGHDSGVLDLIRVLKTYSDTLELAEDYVIDKRGINDTFILAHPTNSELGSSKGNPLGDRRDSYSNLVSQTE